MSAEAQPSSTQPSSTQPSSTQPSSTQPTAAQRRRRRLYPVVGGAATVLVGVVVFQACSGDQRPDPTDLGYPAAPAQEIPAPQVEAGSVGEVPITELVDPEWAEATAQRTQIPERALAAYAGAAVHLAQAQPECGLGWNTLAGIGRVESAHGAHGGASIDADGVVDPPIIGVALDGSEGLMEIPDTDDGELDGDDEWDRAVGPMQFIPTTWERYATDGSHTGEADVHQYDDAALTAGVYLCDSGEDLTTDRGWNDAVTAYNQSIQYANDVADYAAHYSDHD